MDFATLAPAVFSLAGVALGTIGSLLGVYYAQRTAREQVRLQHATTMRNERKEILLQYLDAVEDSWAFLDGLWGRQPLVTKSGEPIAADAIDAIDREAARRNHDVWYQQQKLNLVGSTSVRATSLELTKALYNVTFKRDRIESGLWQYLEPIQERFLVAAREALSADPEA
jgi:hypothetical protein